MSQEESPIKAVPFGRRNLWLAGFSFIPLFLVVNIYMHMALGENQDPEQAAVAACIYFLAGIYIGRHFAQIWAVRKKSIPSDTLYAVGGITGATIVLLFLHAQFLFEKKPMLNLLLFGIIITALSISLGAFIKLVRISVQLQLQEAQASAEHSISELHLLQSQLSPHFLFNTLNNLYGISISKHEKVPALLLKLSDLLRYSVYDAKELFVPLKEEIQYIHNYIEFEKIRIGEGLMLNAQLEEHQEIPVKIAPMLLIVFIENAFKHAKNTTDQHISIEISLKTWGNSILFSVKNSYRNPLHTPTALLKKNSGFGLANVQKRLELLYPKAHTLTTEQTDTHYLVMLQLKAK